MVWVIYTSGPSPSGPRALPAQIVERIKGLLTPTDPEVMMGGNDTASVNFNDPGEDEPISVILTTARGEALQSGAEALGKLDQPGVDQASLKLGLDMWLSEPHIRVMPRHVKNDLFYWGWLGHLRLYGQLANKAFLLKSSNPAEARRLMDRVGNGIRLLATKACERQSKVEDARSRSVEIEKIWEGMTEMADVTVWMDNQRRAEKAEIAELWSLLVPQTGHVPDCLRRMALTNCTPEEMQQLEHTIYGI
ncbi:hypothetical protein FACUT_4095 [Fusarium acutatum]|uniref:Uncharacterized protein n=1 Tax=Fusarium acutatum TaxID=78861 RepID=A0A8H4JYZ3_9HYPO|nr:hypothetical protein FACUT_4095 [Fusarium acutatum]